MSLYNEAQLAGDEPLYQNDSYEVYIRKMGRDAQFEGQYGYRVYNKHTGVEEGETNAEFSAINSADNLHQQRMLTMARLAAEEAPSEDDDFEGAMEQYRDLQSLREDLGSSGGGQVSAEQLMKYLGLYTDT